MSEKMTSNALELMDRRYPPTPADMEMRIEFQQQMDIAQLVHDARVKAGLTQAQLAKTIGVAESVIASLEDAQYDGHAMILLGRIAEALDLRINISFSPRQEAA